MASDYLEIHVDETGDRGFSSKSSPYFCLAACAFRHSKAPAVIEAMEKLNLALGRPPRQPIHAAKHLRTHGKLMEAVERLAILPVRVFYVILPKASTPSDATMRSDDHFTYNYLARLLLERMSWFARDAGVHAQPVFAAVKRMGRQRLDSYIDHLHYRSTEIDWPWLKLPVEVDHAKNRVGMQWADIAGRAIWKATTPSAEPPRRIESAYLEALCLVIWRRRRLETYGIKSITRGWHTTQPWWDNVASAIPEGTI